MRKILFVDDEPGVLDGLRNLLRKQRREWEMVFATGAESALAELGRAPYDVVVSDMQMPGMDGAALLAQVRELQPAAARIVLSGHCSKEAIARALPVAHQFISKPCDAETIHAVVARACDLRSLLDDDRIRAAVGGLDKLPSSPRIYCELTKVAADPDADLTKVAALMETDPAMCAKLLQLVNSAYFGLAQKVTDVQRAVSYLGVETLRDLVLSVHVFDCGCGVPGLDLDSLRDASLLTARLAKRFAPDEATGHDAFTAGIVHNIGKIVAAKAAPDVFASVLRDAAESGRSARALEKERMGADHAELGAYLLGVWGLPASVVQSVRYHHEPSACPGPVNRVLVALHAADALLDEARGDGEAIVDRAFLDRHGVAAKLPEWKAIAAKALADATEGLR